VRDKPALKSLAFVVFMPYSPRSGAMPGMPRLELGSLPRETEVEQPASLTEKREVRRR
jgi:hypothetical protein